MPTAATAEKSRSVVVLARLIRLDWKDHELDCRTRFAHIGELLHELRPQITTGQWQRFIRKNFPFSPHSAARYEKFFLAGTGGRARPQRLSDVDPPRPRHHQAPVHEDVRHRMEQARVWHARIAANQKQRASQEPERRDQMAAANRIIDTGFKVEARAAHPDHGGSDYAMRVLTAARDMLRRSLVFARATS